MLFPSDDDLMQESENCFFEDAITDDLKEKDEDKVAKIEQEEIEAAKKDRAKKGPSIKLMKAMRKGEAM